MRSQPRLGGDASPYLPQRTPLGHEVPTWVGDGAAFFVTVCVEDRAAWPLVRAGIAEGLLASVRFLHERHDWFVRIFLVMPDHVHGLIALPHDQKPAARIAAWKSYTAKRLRVLWQARFFDHRLRSDESVDEESEYIRMNPVRAGLVASADMWPHVFDGFQPEGRAKPPAEPSARQRLGGDASPYPRFGSGAQ